VEKTQQALARSRRASRRETVQRASQNTRVDQQDTQAVAAQDSASVSQDTAQDSVQDTVQDSASVAAQDTVQDSASVSQDTQDETPHGNTTDTAQDSASVPLDESTAPDALAHVAAQNSAVESPSAVESMQAAQAALAHAREAEQRARDAANDARKIAQQAQRDFDRIKLDAEQAALAAKRAQYKIDVVTASSLDALPELRQKILSGGMIAVRAFQSAVETGVLTVRMKKARVGRTTSTVAATPTVARAPGRVLTAEEITDIVERAQHGEKPGEIARVHNLHHVTISAILSGRISAK
jgi:hypothetical protein